jgi:hypothetical protein
VTGINAPLRIAALLGLGFALLAAPAVAADEALAEAQRRAEAAEKRALAAEKRVKELERQLKAKSGPATRRAPQPGSDSAADRAAERETTRRLDDAINRQYLRDLNR